MIQPVNGHLVIEPVKHEQFIASGKETYEEIGIIIAFPTDVQNLLFPTYADGKWQGNTFVGIGDKVYFDSWLAAKYPKNETEWYWLVLWSDVRAIEKKDV